MSSKPQYWLSLSLDDIPRVLVEKEAAIVCKEENAPQLVEDLFDITCRVREAIASNRGNSLSRNKQLIPRTLRAAALHILRLQWLTRFSLAVSAARRKTAEDPEAPRRKLARA